MTSRRRFTVLAGGASCAVALTGLLVAGTPSASAHQASAAQTGLGAARTTDIGPRPPIGRAKASGDSPFAGPADTASPWTPLVNPPPFGTPGTMLLESDGTVLVHNEPDNDTTGGTNAWWKLTPDAHGNYADGTWSQIASMPAAYTPLYFASAILPDGRMIVEGGEYIGENAVWSNAGAIYNPVTDSWASVAPPPGWTSIGDAASEVLPDGTFILQQPCNDCATNPDLVVDAALLNAKTMKWTVIPGTGKNDPNDEEGWNLEPNGKMLAVDLWIPAATQLFDPHTNTWSFAGNTATGGNPVNPLPVVEIGPQSVTPSGTTFVVGAGSSTQEAPTACTTDAPTQTAVYQYTTSTWSAGPQIPAIGGEEYDSTDGPAATLPDGDVLFDASACVYNTPTHFFVYNTASNTLTQIADAPNAVNDSSYYTRMLMLPNGQVLYDDGSNQMEVYTADGTPQASWAPSITALSSTKLHPGRTYSLSGQQLAGLDQGAAYGDDAQDNTNFPLVRITNTATGVVTYARTSDWSSVSIAPGAKSQTKFTVPASTPAGPSTLVVVANGIASTPLAVTIP